jgi:N-acetylglucosaminyldiphosphoundecaprenol N-acetyl-beta-D-mannosaminyltransferase
MKTFIPVRYVLDVPVGAIPFDEQIFLILKWSRLRESRVICLANVHMLIEAHWNQSFALVLQKADLVSSDGMPLVWMLRQMGVYNQNRVAGMDVFLRLCQLAPQSGVSIFFLGSEKTVLEKIKARLSLDFPDLQVAGMESLPFRSLTPTEDEALIAKINQSGAGLVMVCLGCPKQEMWMDRHKHRVKAVMIGVGAVFSVYAGLNKRASHQIRNLGLEWLYRLIQEPGRLWKRYSQTIPPFLYLAGKQLLVEYLLENPARIERIVAKKFEKNNLIEFSFENCTHAKIGEILVRQNLISKDSLAIALQEQRTSSQQIGAILVKKKFISQEELNYHLENQKIKLGEMLVSKKIISSRLLNKMLSQQQLIKNKLGEMLVERKVISFEKLSEILLEQHFRKEGQWLAANQLELNRQLEFENINESLDLQANPLSNNQLRT